MGTKLCGYAYKIIDGGRDRDDQERKSSQELDMASSIVNHLNFNHRGAYGHVQAHNIGLGTMLATLLRFCIHKIT